MMIYNESLLIYSNTFKQIFFNIFNFGVVVHIVYILFWNLFTYIYIQRVVVCLFVSLYSFLNPSFIMSGDVVTAPFLNG